MKNQFCKIFEVRGYQVLIMKAYDDEDDSYKVNQITDAGFQITMGLGYESEKRRDEVFDNYNHESAVKFFDSIKSLLTKK